MHAIIGITGNVGGATTRALLEDGKKVRGIVRDKTKAAAWESAGVELAVADMLDTDAMASALRDVEGVFVMIPANFQPSPGFPEPRAIASALRKAIDAARPPKCVYLSSVGAHHDRGLGLITQRTFSNRKCGPCPWRTSLSGRRGSLKIINGMSLPPVSTAKSMFIWNRRTARFRWWLSRISGVLRRGLCRRSGRGTAISNWKGPRVIRPSMQPRPSPGFSITRLPSNQSPATNGRASLRNRECFRSARRRASKCSMDSTRDGSIFSAARGNRQGGQNAGRRTS